MPNRDLQTPAIDIRNVTVLYRRYSQRASSLKESAIKLAKKQRFNTYSTFPALSGVSLSVNKGEVLALLGANASGKSTLLKVISRVLTPTSGVVKVEGTVGALELGAGFDPELNAIENIYLNGSLHRRRRAEMRDRIDPILEFAELREFAYTPIKYYSSGMCARLGFSVAVDLHSDILLIDEILSVGDERFQVKCQEVFRHLVRRGTTVVLVTHSMETVRALAGRAAVLSKGMLTFVGDVGEATRHYSDETYQMRLEATPLAVR